MALTKKELTDAALEIVRELYAMADAKEPYTRFTYLSRSIRHIWRKSAWLMEELIAEKYKKGREK